MQISALVVDPEFQVALKGIHEHGVEGAFIIGPIGVPLMENWSIAGEAELTEATHAETL